MTIRTHTRCAASAERHIPNRRRHHAHPHTRRTAPNAEAHDPGQRPSAERPVTIRRARPDHSIHGTGGLLNIDQAAYILGFWAYGDYTRRGNRGVIREWRYSARGLFIIALNIDDELKLATWESSARLNGADLYSTTTLPLDFDVKKVRR